MAVMMNTRDKGAGSMLPHSNSKISVRACQGMARPLLQTCTNESIFVEYKGIYVHIRTYNVMVIAM